MGMKVVHLPMPIGGMPRALAKAEKKIGLESSVVHYQEAWPFYEYDYCLHWEQKDFIQRVIGNLSFFLKVRNKYDVFHFNFGTTLLNFNEFKRFGLYMLDLPFYPKDKKLIFTYNGCDARQKFPTMRAYSFSACHDENCYKGICNSGRKDFDRQNEIVKVGKYADHIFAVNPDILKFLPKGKSSFLPYVVSGWDDIVSEPLKPIKKLKILHAPTQQGAKGTKYILRAIENLRLKYDFDFELVEGLSHKMALEKYAEADLIIDQVLIGWYGGFAVEVMKMGKPVVVFIREDDLEHIPSGMKADIGDALINANPFTIEEVLSIYLENPQLLMQKSQAALDFVHKWHAPDFVANITKNIYER